MAVPDFQSLMLPMLKLTADRKPHSYADAVDYFMREFRLSEEDRGEELNSGQKRLNNRTYWAATYLRRAGLLRSTGPGRFEITGRGESVLAENPARIDIAFLSERFVEIAELRRSRLKTPTVADEAAAFFDPATVSWTPRPEVGERIREKLERWMPDESTRRAALSFLAFAIENADEERPDAWFLREIKHGVRLMTGRLIACEIDRTHLKVSVMGPIDDDVRASVGVDAEEEEEFKKIPGAVLLKVPVDRADRALEHLQDSFNAFVDLAMARVRTPGTLEEHAPEAVTYVATQLNRELPQPVPTSSPDSDDEEATDEGEAGPNREPAVRGRPPIFEHGQRAINSLVSDIENDEIALPDMQRPFVWEDSKVRDLLDSLFLGFPVGTLVLWHTTTAKNIRSIGKDPLKASSNAGLRASALVIDGQQRLTSLHAVMRGEPVVGKDGEPRQIVIAFRPRDGRFAVADAATRNDPEYLSNITELWTGTRSKSQIRKDLLIGLRDQGRAVDDKYEDAVERNIERAHAISEYRFPTVDIRGGTADGTEATDEDVAEIFVRINNQGARLGQADFVLTLLSVFHSELRDRIEVNARAMSNDSVLPVDTQQILRAACAVAFGRARMAAVYRYLRGLDPSSKDTDPTRRDGRLKELDDAANACMDPGSWRDFVLRVRRAGFVSSSLIASRGAIINSYSFYVRGKRASVPKHELDSLVSRWLFATLLTARYSTSSETIFEQDLGRVIERGTDPDSFVATLDSAMSEALTEEFWDSTLVRELETMKGRSPAALAFRAAQVILKAKALFGDQPIQNLLEAPSKGTRSASEQHHLFPVAWLNARGVRDRRRVNQVANLADAGWFENATIGSRGPADYVPRLREKLRMSDERWGILCAEHALPNGWELMEYEQFLVERRRRMADIIRVAYRELGGEASAAPLTPPWFLPGTEDVWRRISEAERTLRAFVRDAYGDAFGANAGSKIVAALSETERTTLDRATRSRRGTADPLSVVDYLYLAQLPKLLFESDVWPRVSARLVRSDDARARFSTAIEQIAPVRNEIAHVREVAPDRLLRATVACADLLEFVRTKPSAAS
jgi:hypothetical protein